MKKIILGLGLLLQLVAGSAFAQTFATNNLIVSGTTTLNGAPTVSYSNPVLILNDSSGSNSATLQYNNNGAVEWKLLNNSSTNLFTLSRYVSGSLVDSPITVSNSTGLVTLADGLAVTGTVSGTGFSNYLASPPAIGGTSAAAGTFTTLTSSNSLVANGTISGVGFTNYFASPPAIGGTTANTGTFTTLNATSSTASSSTTTGALVVTGGVGVGGGMNVGGTATVGGLVTSSATINGGAINGTSIGGTTASTGTFTTIQATSTITPSTTAGIVGTTVGDNANSGSVGEFLTTTNNSATSLSNNTYANAASLTLTAGDWDVWGFASIQGSTNNISNSVIAISTVSAPSSSNPGGYFQIFPGGSVYLMTGISGQAPLTRINVSSSTTIYLSVYAAFGSGTVSVSSGAKIFARRVR